MTMLNNLNFEKHFLFFVLLLSAIFLSRQVNAQITNSDIVIKKNNKRTIYRIEKKQILDKKDLKGKERKKYGFQHISMPAVETSERINYSALGIKDKNINPTHNLYLKAGLGNYLASLFQLRYSPFNKIKNHGYYGITLDHLAASRGPVQKENSAQSFQNFNAFFSDKKNKFRFGGNINFQRHGYHLYGYPKSLDLEKLKVNEPLFPKRTTLQLGAYTFLEWESTRKVNRFKLSPAVKNFTLGNNNDDRETTLETSLEGVISLNQNLSIKYDGFLYLSQYKTNAKQFSRRLFSVSPAINYKYYEFDFSAGINMAYENDSIDGGGQIHLYPNIELKYQATPETAFLLGLKGQIKPLGLSDVYQFNPYVSEGFILNHQNTKIDFYGGIQLFRFESLITNIKLGYQKIDHLLTYDINPKQVNTFIAAYDKETSNFYIDVLGSIDIKDNFKIKTALKYNSFKTNKIEEAWQLPKLILDIGSEWMIYEKISMGLTINTRFNRSVNDLKLASDGRISDFSLAINREKTKMKPIVDVSFTGNYKISPKLGTFINMYNMVSTNYPLFNNYTSRGISVIIGAFYKL